MKKKILLKNIQDNTNKYVQIEEEEIEKGNEYYHNIEKHWYQKPELTFFFHGCAQASLNVIYPLYNTHTYCKIF